VAVTDETQDPARLAQFWATLLGREPIEDVGGVLLPGADGQLGLRFVADGAPPHSRHRMHVHLTSTSLRDQQHIVTTALELGANHLDIGQRPEEGHIVLSDPGDYAFCVIEPDNRYLAGCGRLGGPAGKHPEPRAAASPQYLTCRSTEPIRHRLVTCQQAAGSLVLDGRRSALSGNRGVRHVNGQMSSQGARRRPPDASELTAVRRAVLPRQLGRGRTPRFGRLTDAAAEQVSASRSEAVPLGEGYLVPLWRAIAVFRVASLVYAAVTVLQNFENYRHPSGGLFVLGVMTCWTAVAVYGFPPSPRLRWPALLADLAVAAACLLATMWVETPARLSQPPGVPPLTVAWMAGAVLAWAVCGGRRAGLFAAVVISACDVVVHLPLAPHGVSQATLNGPVLLLLSGFAVGQMARLAGDAQRAVARGARLEAAARERERLARGIHDSVLQVLALVQRQAVELGGEAAELGRLAGEQEVALRALVSVSTDSEPVRGQTDLRALIAPMAGAAVSVAAPATAVRMATLVARELALAVSAALENVRQHCREDTQAWVLVEDESVSVTVTIRDNGPGIALGRLEEAAEAGRLGVAQSILGRVRDLGGSARVTSAPGEGTEIELRVPR
jgi:signal transduction histidine kinase